MATKTKSKEAPAGDKDKPLVSVDVAPKAFSGIAEAVNRTVSTVKSLVHLRNVRFEKPLEMVIAQKNRKLTINLDDLANMLANRRGPEAGGGGGGVTPPTPNELAPGWQYEEYTVCSSGTPVSRWMVTWTSDPTA